MDPLTQEEAERLVARLTPQLAWPGASEPTLETLAEFMARPVDEVAQELEILRRERRLEELERERQAEQQRLAEIKAAREAAAKARETPEEAESKRQAWLERQQLFYEKTHLTDQDVSPERVRKGWQAIDAADTEKPVRRRNPMMPIIVVVLALLGFCFVLQMLSAIGNAGRGSTPPPKARTQ